MEKAGGICQLAIFCSNKKNSSFDIIDLNGAKYLNYSPDNGVNIEQPLPVRVEGYPEVWLNDTLLLMSYKRSVIATLIFLL